MRVTRTATAALTLILSGSLAVGISGTAAAGTPNTPTGRASAPQDTEARQLRAIKDLGQLAELTGRLGRATRDQGSNLRLARAVQERVERQVRRVLDAVEQDRPATTLPAPGEERRVTTTVVTTSGASHSFQRSVQRVVSTRHGTVKSRSAASDSLLRHLSQVNRAALDEVGLPVGTSTPGPVRPAAPKSAITSTLIDRDTLPSGDLDVLASGDLGRYDDAVEAVTELIEDVREAPDGRLSQADSYEHATELNQALIPLRQRAALRGSSTPQTAAVDDLQDRADALLTASRTDDARKIRAESRRLMRETVKLLGTMPAGSSLSDGASGSGTADPYGADDAERVWTGMLLSPMLR
ncbi:hypothetical protein [Streptomyces albidus (ex Kaewkla and Franco 2022)]|uniref:hypothetical protein n=1 Tax=Streptomyces albidus (ex Kaewkla and Franco 2022) TaxID=722709 RepID=UPI0015EFA736|nr:hypothetical protein [Streptomyces albidus (ex Kaewkla and Franco 2022)]